MKILITSDVHGNVEDYKEVVKKHKDAKYHLNAGDFGFDNKYLSNDVITVKGNCDFFSNLPLERILNIDGLKILLTHGHKEGVKYSLDKLKLKAKILNVDICIFGHTHQKYMKVEEGILFINPGALSGYPKSYAIYENNKVIFKGL